MDQVLCEEARLVRELRKSSTLACHGLGRLEVKVLGCWGQSASALFAPQSLASLNEKGVVDHGVMLTLVGVVIVFPVVFGSHKSKDSKWTN